MLASKTRLVVLRAAWSSSACLRGTATSVSLSGGKPKSEEDEKEKQPSSGSSAITRGFAASAFPERPLPDEPFREREDQPGSGGYSLLGAAHGGLALTAFLAPEIVVDFFMPGAALPEGFQPQALGQLLGAGFALPASAAIALKQQADKLQLSSTTSQKLQLALMGNSAAAIVLHLMYSPSITMASLLSGAAVMGTTFAIPFAHYTRLNGSLRPMDVLRRYFGAIPDHLNINGLHSTLYSILTPVLALSGASYLFMPGNSLAMVFDYVKGPDSYFLWQMIGATLMTSAPAVTFSLKKLSDRNALHETAAKTLNLGLFTAAAGHLAVLGPMYVSSQGGSLLTGLLGTWSLAALTSASGLFKTSTPHTSTRA